MRVGLIGLPRSGKTSVFNAITRSSAPVHAYDAHDTTVHTAVVPVPDRRFDVTVAICQPKKRVPAAIEVVDGAARIQAHERGQKFGTDFFSGVRGMDALVLVLGAFEEDVAEDQAVRDAELVNQELILADLTVVDGRLERLAKSRSGHRNPGQTMAEENTLKNLAAMLEESRPLRSCSLDADGEHYARAFGLVSAKPLILVLNIAERDLGKGVAVQRAAEAYADSQGVPLIVMCARLEAELAAMEPEEEREFLDALGIAEPARDALIRVAYAHMGLISFLTIASDEVRMWTIRRGTTAVGAAEKVHTDLARNFIRAEVMSFEDFEAAGGWEAGRAAGKMRLEGKDYVVRDGDILHIRASRG